MTNQNSVPTDIASYMAGPMPAPSEADRQAALETAVLETLTPPAPPAGPPPSPASTGPDITQPTIDQPDPFQQPPIQQPQAQTDYQKELAARDAELASYRARESAFEQQQREIEAQRQAAEAQQVQDAARQYGIQQYQKYLTGGISDEQARQWAYNDAATVYQAVSYRAQQQQADAQAQTVARRYGINPQELAGFPPDGMEKYAALLSRLNRVEAGNQQVQQQFTTQQTFDSNIGGSTGDPIDNLLAQIGDPNKVADPRLLDAWTQWMNQNLRR